MNVNERKKQEADIIVKSLDELFPKGETADSDVSNTHRSQAGAVNVKKVKQDSSEEEVEYLRVPELGSVEAYRLPSGEYAVKRRDKLPHNE
jgi:hypothetical protein